MLAYEKRGYKQEPTKVQLSIDIYSIIFKMIFQKVLGPLQVQSLVLPNPIFFVTHKILL